MKSIVTTGPGTAPAHSISNQPDQGGQAMTRLSRLMRAYAKHRNYSVPLIIEGISYQEARSRFLRRLEAATLANQIAAEIRTQREAFYSSLANNHCEEISKRLNDLRRVAKRLCLDEQLMVELIAIQCSIEQAWCNPESERSSRVITLQHNLDRIGRLLRENIDPMVTVRLHWGYLYALALKGDRTRLTEQATISMDTCYQSMRHIEPARTERAEQIRRYCLRHAERLNIDIGMRWRSPKKPRF